MKLFRFALPVLGLIFLGACARVDSMFIPDIVINTTPKTDYEKVEVFTQQPSRNALRIGKISTDGNGSADFEDLIEKAKKEAAKLGGDFILCENSGVETNTTYIAGHTSFNSNANLNWGSYNGYGNSKTTAYSTGPSVVTTKSPWSVFSIWVYAPSQLGLRMDSGNVVESFHLNSDADMAGVKVGDRLIGINGYDILDEKTVHHLMTVHPGDKVKLTLHRDGKRIEKQITALTN